MSFQSTGFLARPWRNEMKVGTGKFQVFVRRRFSQVHWDFNDLGKAIEYVNEQHTREIDDLGSDRDFRVRWYIHGHVQVEDFQ